MQQLLERLQALSKWDFLFNKKKCQALMKDIAVWVRGARRKQSFIDAESADNYFTKQLKSCNQDYLLALNMPQMIIKLHALLKLEREQRDEVVHGLKVLETTLMNQYELLQQEQIYDQIDQLQHPSFFRRHWKKMLIGTLAVAGIAVLSVFTAGVIPVAAGHIAAGLAAAKVTVSSGAALGLTYGGIAAGGGLVGFASAAGVGAVSEKVKFGFWRRHWKKIAVGAVLTAGLVVTGLFTAGIVPAFAGVVSATFAASSAVATGIAVSVVALGGLAVGAGVVASGSAVADIKSKPRSRRRTTTSSPAPVEANVERQSQEKLPSTQEEDSPSRPIAQPKAQPASLGGYGTFFGEQRQNDEDAPKSDIEAPSPSPSPGL